MHDVVHALERDADAACELRLAHPEVIEELLADRREVDSGRGAFIWPTANALAYASRSSTSSNPAIRKCSSDVSAPFSSSSRMTTKLVQSVKENS